ncbi:MAG TPA: pyruvate formate lyase-activating protein [Methanosarcinales archaeon]|nr:pyruvate formate lyase-activating protein [Methanosarcinales archaeon]
MQTVAIDVGAGTQDILIYDSKKQIEQCFKMVLPSQTVIVAKSIRNATHLGRDIFLTGGVMGGGACVRAVKKHLKAGLQVYSTKDAAKTIYDDLDRVSDLGVILVPQNTEPKTDAVRIETGDIDLPAIKRMLGLFGVDMPETFAVAVQDHGESMGSNRIFRFEHLRKVIDDGGDLRSFVYTPETIPAYLTRMSAVAWSLSLAEADGGNVDDVGVVVMDTGPAAVFGAAYAAEDPSKPTIVVNIGNGHTLCAILMDDRITGIFEHHTRQITIETLDIYVEKLAAGTLTFEEVFESGGHGCHIREAPGELPQIIVTGPNRKIAEQSRHDIVFAAPYGDMMLTGCFGLIEGLLSTRGADRG